MSIKVFINGAGGKMGQEAVTAVQAHDTLELVGQGHRGDDLSQAIKDSGAEVVVDLTAASVARDNAQIIIESGAHPVIGTSGLLPKDVQFLQELAAAKSLGGIIAPNFSIGAVLMMQYARDAMAHFSNAEIIELHHDEKQDAPSGTAIKTAEMMAQNRKLTPKQINSKEAIPGARGGNMQDIPIHSVRLPGLVAHQSVIFGGHYETLTIRHDSLHRKSFMPGICLCCEKVIGLKELVYGLEHIL